MNKTQDKFSLPAVTLSIFAAAAAERLPVCSSPRALLWQEVLAAVLLMILSALASRFWQSGPPKSAAWAAAFCLQVWLTKKSRKNRKQTIFPLLKKKKGKKIRKIERNF